MSKEDLKTKMANAISKAIWKSIDETVMSFNKDEVIFKTDQQYTLHFEDVDGSMKTYIFYGYDIQRALDNTFSKEVAIGYFNPEQL